MNGYELTSAFVSGAVLLAGAAAGAQQNGMRLERGIELYWSGHYQQTVATLAPVCADETREDARSECFKYLAFSHVALGDTDSAQRAFGSLLAKDAEYHLDESLVSPKILDQFYASRRKLLQALFEEGKAAYFAKDYEATKAVMGRILRLDPQHQLASEYGQLADEQLALREKEASLATASRDPDPAPAAPEPEPDPEDRVYHMTGRMTRPVLVERTQPSYPATERALRNEGTVVLTAVIDADGSVRDAKVVRSVSPRLDQAAVEAVLRWRYRPARLNGRDVAVHTVVHIAFQLAR